MLHLINIDEFCEDLPEVTSPKINDKKKFHPQGIFSQQIFGPVRNYTCECGTYYGPNKVGVVCPKCNVTIQSKDVRRKQFAKIRLPFPIINPLLKEIILSSDRWLKGVINDFLFNENACYVFLEDEQGVVDYNELTEEEKELLPKDVKLYRGIDGLKELIRKFAELYRHISEKWEFVYNNIDCFLINNIIVIPPGVRPIGAVETLRSAGDINRLYVMILEKISLLNRMHGNSKHLENIFAYVYKPIQQCVDKLYLTILTSLGKKKGLVRRNILGKRIDFSGRCVITPDPSLRLDECKIPYIMLLELEKLNIARKLIEKTKFKTYNDAIEFIDECIFYEKYDLFPIVEEVIKDEWCILNRQPTLHRLGMLGFKVLVSKEKVIKIHPLVCPPFNADFDGDMMAVYLPITEESRKEVAEKFSSTKNLTSPANCSLVMTPSQDIVLGIYLITNDKNDFFSDKVELEDGTETISGRVMFNETLPSGFRFVNETMTKKKLISVLDEINRTFPEEEVVETLDKVKKLGFKMTTQYGTTLSLNKMFSNLKEERDKIFSLPNQLDQAKALDSEELEDLLRENFHYSGLIESGARGSWDQVRQLVFCRGFVSDFSGRISEKPVKHSLVEGLNQEEFFISTYGSRKGLLDVALVTGKSGHLTRKCIYTTVNLELDPYLEDCGASDGLVVSVDHEKLARALVFRYYMKDDGSLQLIDFSNYKELIGKTVKLRSPVYCTSERVCRKCYGDLYDITRSRFIGIIASHSLTEVNTQLVLRTFHKSGVAHVDQQQEELEQSDIVSSFEEIQRLLHGKVKITADQLVRRLYEVYLTSKNINLVHFECLVSQLLWYRGQKWRLLPDRDEKPYKIASVQSVPTMESWLLGFALANPKAHIVKGLARASKHTSIFEELLLGRIVERP